jgi:hypothetical protein
MDFVFRDLGFRVEGLTPNDETQMLGAVGRTTNPDPWTLQPEL